MGVTDNKTGSGRDERAERLAEALRENLRRRKAQSRARRGGGAVAPEAAESARDPGHEAGNDNN